MEKPKFDDIPGLLLQLVGEIRAMREEIKELKGTPKELSQTISFDQASVLLDKTKNAIRQLIYRNKLRAIKVENRYYFDREYLEKWKRGEADHQIPNIDKYLIDR